MELFGGEVVVVDDVGGDRRTDQDELGAHLLHDVELALGPPQVGREDLGRDGVEVGRGRRGRLVLQRAGQAHRGDGGA
ncbi:hypothetical protein ACVGVM_12940 [Pseudonocardia bannensis]|uniref:Uncharacterized protein n=1 Tax=Pseudonocardia bannensis TaxID=630973 RepID=A0A848DSL7_9PSEU|nr:hypothetical protein [Pseudonocardia bannensis]NMH95503.1 hypothetical protein [Pseudonocardia bannensis]